MGITLTNRIYNRRSRGTGIKCNTSHAYVFYPIYALYCILYTIMNHTLWFSSLTGINNYNEYIHIQYSYKMMSQSLCQRISK